MCGLAGICGTDFASDHALNSARVRALLDDMAHRGPDDEGFWEDKAVSLGHRRLQILDLTQHSHQPAVCAGGSRVLVYNGEVYNHADLVPVPLASDTLALCELSGEIEPTLLRGMFAIVVWHVAERRLDMTRDRFGIKPLYYSASPEGLAFASYASATATASGRTMLDGESLASYLRLGSVQGPRSIFSGVQEVEPGTTLTWQAKRLTEHRYCDFPSRPKRRTRRDVEEALRESVRVHTLSDVPVAVFLSAGLDSTLIAALAADAGLGVHAITIGVPGSGLDEAKEAARSAAALGLEHQIVDLTHDDVDFDGFFASMDQPSIDGLNTYLVAQAAKQAGTRVALTGLGADELFGGYSLFRRLPAMVMAGSLLPSQLRRWVLKAVSDSGKADELAAAGSDVDLLHHALRALWPVQDVLAMTGLSPAVPKYSGTAPLSGRIMDRLTRLELAGYTRNTLLRDADVYGMAHSVEIRTPFLDHVVLETVLGYGQWARTTPAKKLLRDMLRGRGLDHVRRRKKTGFVLPYQEWLAGPLAGRVTGLATGPLPEVLTGDGLRPILDDSRSLPTMQLWSLVVLDAWLRRHQEGGGVLTLADPADVPVRRPRDDDGRVVH